MGSRKKGDVVAYFKNMETGKFISADMKEVMFKNKIEQIKNLYINCFTVIRESDLEKIDGCTYKYRLKKSVQDGLQEIINNRNIYCINYKKFLSTLKNNFSNKGIIYKPSFVEYFDDLHPLYEQIIKKENLKDINVLDFAFYKRDEYKSQKEYRVVAYDLESPLQHFKGMNEHRILFSDLNQIEFLKGTREEILSYYGIEKVLYILVRIKYNNV
ncbi:hypothetical protein AABD41_01585 [Staphylococcus pseudoxylosus]|uniref:hypothetical protein n=1 Tax=Staphylococcus pseudoxylosus TaxID=2282419 RepID=UPI00398B99C3